MAEEDGPVESILRRYHEMRLLADVFIAIAAVTGVVGSLILQRWGGLGFGSTTVICLLITLVATQFPLLTDWGKRNFRLWKSIRPWMASVLAAFLLFIAYAGDLVPKFFGTEPSLSEVVQRLGALESRPVISSELLGSYGPANPAPTQAKITALETQMAKLAKQTDNLRRFGMLQACQQWLKTMPSGRELDGLVEIAKEEAVHPERCPTGAGWPYCPLQLWHEDMRLISHTSETCYPDQKTDLFAEPNPEQMDNKLPNEPPDLDVDQTRRLRRFAFQAARATDIANKISAQIQRDIVALGETFGREGR